ASSNVQQLAATLNDAESQYHQYTTSSTQSSEFSRMATVAQNQSASLDTNYTQEFVDWAANKYGDKAQSMLTSAPSAREAAMEFVNERLKPEIMGDYQQGRSDLTSGQEHAAFSGEHVVQPALGSQQGSGPASNDGGIRYSPVESGSYNSNDTGNHHTDGASQVTEYAGTYGGQVSSGGGSVSVRTGGSVSGSHESSLLAQNQTDSENLAGQREISHNEVHSGYGRQEQSSQIQSGTHRSEQDSLSIKSSDHDTGRHSTERQRSDSSAGMQQELRQSGTLREQGGAAGHRNEMSHSPATMNVEEQRVQGNAMQASFKENQAKLHEQSGQGFGPQNDIQRRVAEQRSENEHKINESAGVIDKKQSTVQASSDILKGENLIGQGRFKLGRAEAELDQSSKLNPFNDLQPDELQQRVAELRKKTGG
ncbi:conjugal transfer protein TraG, partial [Enterobacter bugandensis]